MENIQDKIRKLLALANDGGATEGEAESAGRAAGAEVRINNAVGR